jgi:protein-S-isoprenylcysteine O-methyltransferase Ste14
MFIGLSQAAITLFTGLAYYAVDFWLMRRYDRARVQEGSGRSWGYTASMVLFLLLLVLQPILLPGLSLHLSGGWGLLIQIFGVGLVMVGLGLHWWSRSHLKQFYVEDVSVQDQQALVDTGPYRLVRHPIFTSFFAIALGLLLVNPAITTLGLAIYVFVDFARAARLEEELLSAKIPEYASYVERTGRFVPKWR